MCLVHLYKKSLEKCPKTTVQGNNVFYLTPRRKYKSTDEGMIPINIDHLQFGCKRIKMSFSFNGPKPETVIIIIRSSVLFHIFIFTVNFCTLAYIDSCWTSQA